MNKANTKFLVSFCNNKKNINYQRNVGFIGLVEFDGIQLNYREIQLDKMDMSNFNGATGIARKGDYFFIAIQASTSKLLIVDKSFKNHKVIELEGLKGVHSICFYSGELYIVATKQDKIVKTDLNGNFESVWDLGTNKDTNHLNSICVHRNQLLVSGFGRNDNELWLHAEAGYVYNIHEQQVIMNDLKQPHSLFSFNSSLLVCDSSRKRIIDCKKSELLKVNNGYVRGLYLEKDFLCYGISKGRQTSNTLGKYVGNISDKGILTGDCSFNIKTGKRILSLSLKGIANEIYDIQSFN